MSTTFKPTLYKGCLIERIPHSGMYTARHDHAGLLKADTLGGIKAMISKSNDVEYNQLIHFGACA